MACESHPSGRLLKTTEVSPDFPIYRPPAFLGSLSNPPNPRPSELASAPFTGACDGSWIHRDRQYAVFPSVESGTGRNRSYLRERQFAPQNWWESRDAAGPNFHQPSRRALKRAPRWRQGRRDHARVGDRARGCGAAPPRAGPRLRRKRCEIRQGQPSGRPALSFSAIPESRVIVLAIPDSKTPRFPTMTTLALLRVSAV